jgi:hypothetical protein
MEQRFTKKDFYVGQEVYAECVGLSTARDKEGSISVETVTNVGNKYVTTNKRMYRIADGVIWTDYSPNYVLWINKDEVERKVAKDKLFSKLSWEFTKGLGGLQDQRLYKKLSLEDLQEIERIIEKGETK